MTAIVHVLELVASKYANRRVQRVTTHTPIDNLKTSSEFRCPSLSVLMLITEADLC